MKITLKGDIVKEYENGVSAADIAKSIGMGLYKSACAARVNGKTVDLRTVINEDCALDILTFDDDEGKRVFRHTASHVLAAAVLRLFPSAKYAIGPAIDGGFYYDFDVEKPFTSDDLEKIEAEMKVIVKSGAALERFEKEPSDARELMANQPYKLELLEEHAAKGDKISFYTLGEFTDLCAGPHLMDVGAIKAFKLTSATGAYWRGDSKKAMMCRIYGTAFPKNADLEAHLAAIEDAKKRDHNKIGRELEFFTTADCIGQGLPILLPKGARTIQLLQRFVEDEEQSRGYQLTKTP
ncbi:MAG: TGS domain-containing protein, partial [Oscillospiraceae bacterium]